jgi:hypothetical protein
MFWKVEGKESEFVDTGQFMVTGHGTMFRSTKHSLEEYAPGLMERVPLARLLGDSDLWLRLPMDLSLWILPFGLVQGGPWLGATAMVSVFIATTLLSPSGVSLHALPVVRILDTVLIQAFYFIAILSFLAQSGRFAELWVGVGGFVVLRWSLLSQVTSPMVERAAQRLYGMAVPDQVLRAVIIKHALRFGISPSAVRDIEKDVRSITGGK